MEKNVSKMLKKASALAAAITPLIGITQVYASGIVTEIQGATNTQDDGALASVKSIITQLSGSVISLILVAVTAVSLIAAAVALLLTAAGGQRGKEEAKGKFVIAAICIILAVPTTFFAVMGFIEKVGTEASNSNGNGTSDDSNNGNVQQEVLFNITLPNENGAPTEYIVRI